MAKPSAKDEAAMAAEIEALGAFENEDVLAATVAITNAGDGLSKALAVHPVILHRGDKVYVVLECHVDKLTFGGIKGAPNAVSRLHVLKAGSASLVDEKLVRDALDKTEEAIERRAGVVRLPLGATDPDAPDSDNGEEG